MTGGVGILNVGAGDTKLVFDRDNPQEMIRAARIVRDMIRRGYALLVATERDGKVVHQRAYDFIEGTCEYIIADLDPLQAEIADEKEQAEATASAHQPETEPTRAGPTRRGRPPTKRVHAADTKVVAVARTAGG